MKLRRPADEAPADELARLQAALPRAERDLAAAEERLQALNEREAELAAQDADAYLGNTDPHEHERRRQAHERDKAEALHERERMQRVADTIKTRMQALHAQARREGEQAILDRIASLRAREAQQLAIVAETRRALEAAEAEHEELTLPEPSVPEVAWHVRQMRDGLPLPPMNRKLERAVHERIERERERLAFDRGPDLTRVRLPSGAAAYQRLPRPEDVLPVLLDGDGG